MAMDTLLFPLVPTQKPKIYGLSKNMIVS